MKLDIIAILSCLILGVYLIFSPFFFVQSYYNFSSVFLGFIVLGWGISVFYSKNTFSPIIKKFLLILFVSVGILGLVLIIYILIFSLKTPNSIIIDILIYGVLLTILLVFILILVFANKSEMSKVRKGTKFIDNKKYEEALDYFENLLELDPENAIAWSFKAQTLLRLDNYEKAITSADRALDIKLGIRKFLVKNNINSIRNNTKAEVLLQQKKYAESIKYADKSLESSLTKSYPLTIKGNALLQLGKYEEAIECFNEILEKNPENPFILNNKGYALAKMKKYDESLKNIDKSLELQPELANTLDSKGFVLSELGKNEEAIKYVQKAIEIDPKDPKLQYNAGKIYQKLQKNNEALECLNNALKLDPSCEEAKKAKDEIL